jgi:hypothetical protein
MKNNEAQHSVHPIPDKDRRGHGGGSLRVFKRFVWLGVGSGKMTLSRPAHQRVTRTVRRFIVIPLWRKSDALVV